MAQFTVNALHRVDPYKNFKFRIRLGTRVVAGVSKVSALKRTTEVVRHREGGDPSTSHKSPGRTEYEAITIERGVSHDLEFQSWASQSFRQSGAAGGERSADFRRPLTIEVLNEAGQVAVAYNVFKCWVSEYQAASDLDANANAVLIEQLKIENEGWERDASVVEPAEPVLAV